MSKNVKTLRFDEDGFDLSEHKKAADASTKQKARVKRVRRQIKYGKIILAILTIVLFFVLFIAAAELGLMNIR